MMMVMIIIIIIIINYLFMMATDRMSLRFASERIRKIVNYSQSCNQLNLVSRNVPSRRGYRYAAISNCFNFVFNPGMFTTKIFK